MVNNIKRIEPGTASADWRIAIVVSRYNSYVVDRLVQGCLARLAAAGLPDGNITLVKVPGAFEIPVAAAEVARKRKVDAIITLGAVIRGETPHFDFICCSCADGIARVALDYQLPVIFGVLTVDTSQQAMDRSGEEESNKGTEAAQTALDMISVLGKIRA